jgi:UDP-N-acetylmuramate--alanine ligase
MRVPVPEVVPAVGALGRVHLVGIGGAALSGIARLLLARGCVVSGSDAADSPTLHELRALGVRCWVGHAAEQIGDADTVVVSTAVREDNPEVLEARRRHLLLLPRSAALVSLTADRTVLAVAGTHGKTTTSSMLTMALRATGADPSYAIGARVTATGTNAFAGTGDAFVLEADESDGAFLAYSPTGAVVTNVDADHLDVWGTPHAYEAGFLDFTERIRPGGFLVCCVDDSGAARLADAGERRGVEVIRVALADGPGAMHADLLADDIALAGMTSAFVVRPGRTGLAATSDSHEHGWPSGPVRLQVPGRHYVLDALAALAVGLRLGHQLPVLAAGLAEHTGSSRRMEPKGERNGVLVYDSYAHHPVEIAADLAGARAVAGSRRLVVAYQPHLVSRTRAFGAAMGEALGVADVVMVTDVYVAREEPDPAVTGALVAGSVPLPADRVHYVADVADVAEALAALARPGDLVLTLGAGDITDVAPRLLELLAPREGAEL